MAVAVLPVLAGLSLGQEKTGPAHGQTVALVIDYGNGVKKLYTSIPWRKGITVLDAMSHAKATRPALDFVHTGKGETAFVTEIDGFKNEGGEKDKRNWIYWINGELAGNGAGVSELSVGDVIIWRFNTWKPGE